VARRLVEPAVDADHAVKSVEGGVEAVAIIVDQLDLDTYHLFHAVRADLLARLGRNDDAALAYDRALDLATNAAERILLEKKRKSLPSVGS
jgi:RNA polymerase sigma-70 factor (ECF subfamily)